MRYLSTRGGSTPVSFRDAILTGLAPDGGLYLPERYPAAEIPKSRDPLVIAEAVLKPYADDLDLLPILEKAWADFDDPALAPITDLGEGLKLLELFHGPTLAFKDFGLQFLGQLFEALSDKPLTVLGATSGDTGAAAVQALKGKKNVRLFMLHPKGRITDVQRRQMTTAIEDNIFNIAVEGSFDDCQRLVKAALGDQTLARRHNLTTVNSINWGRILAQSVYYWWAALTLAENGPAHFVVPSGNFGNAFSAYVARSSGAPIAGVLIATNANDILARTFKEGRYAPAAAVATMSPAMDIQIASNFERLLFEASGRDPAVPLACVKGVAEGGYVIPGDVLNSMKNFFSADAASEAETAAAMRDVYDASGRLIDPHTAVGYAVWRKARIRHKNPVLLATAHPAKFPEATAKATGQTASLPAGLASLMTAEEISYALEVGQGALAKFIEKHS